MTDQLRAAAEAALEALVRRDAKPAAWIREDTAITTDAYQASCWRDAHTVTPLYTHPPRREWVSLTDDEIADAIRPLCLAEETVAALLKCSMDEYRAIESALKERNT